jgi:hypothetical protein
MMNTFYKVIHKNFLTSYTRLNQNNKYTKN